MTLPVDERRSISASRWVPLALGVLVIVVGAEQFRVAWSTSCSLVNSDGALLWYTAREFGHFRFHQPNFFGQSYGTPLEGIWIELTHRVGMTYATATALVLLALFLGGWFALGAAAWRRGRRGCAVVAIVAPMVFSAYHAVFVTLQPVSPTPRLLAVAGAAMLIAGVVEPLAWVLFAFALVTDPSTALVSVPVAAWFVIDQGLSRRRTRSLAIGALVGVAWLVGCRVFYARHPDYAFHPNVSLRPSIAILRYSLARPDRLFSLYAPELWRWWGVAALLLAVLVAACIVTRRRLCVVPALVVVVIVLFALATPRAEDHLGVALPAGRIFLALPYAMWFLAFLLAEHGVRWSAAVVAVVVCAFVGAGLRTFDFGGRVLTARDAIAADSSANNFPLDRPEVVAARCRDARDARAGIAVFTSDIKMAYACAALEHGMATLTPTFDRRTWVLYDAARHPRTNAWIDGKIVTFPPGSVLPVLRSAGIRVRVFGPHCRPDGPYALRTCKHPEG